MITHHHPMLRPHAFMSARRRQRCADCSTHAQPLQLIVGHYAAIKLHLLRGRLALKGCLCMHARRQFSLADIAYAPGMERLAANLPVMRGFELRANAGYPRTGAWFGALDARPAYQRVKSDDTTHNLVFRRAPLLLFFFFFGFQARSSCALDPCTASFGCLTGRPLGWLCMARWEQASRQAVGRGSLEAATGLPAAACMLVRRHGAGFC